MRLSDRVFPPYAHVPGVTPHPVRDPAGHSYRVAGPDIAPPESSDWRRCPTYCWGIDLFNAGYYWEAHEAWEGVWIAAGRRGEIADFLKALIKLSAAGVKLREGVPAGARRHLRRASELLEIVSRDNPSGDNSCLGLELSALRGAVHELLSRPLPLEPSEPIGPAPILGIILNPR